MANCNVSKLFQTCRVVRTLLDVSSCGIVMCQLKVLGEVGKVDEADGGCALGSGVSAGFAWIAKLLNRQPSCGRYHEASRLTLPRKS